MQRYLILSFGGVLLFTLPALVASGEDIVRQDFWRFRGHLGPVHEIGFVGKSVVSLDSKGRLMRLRRDFGDLVEQSDADTDEDPWIVSFTSLVEARQLFVGMSDGRVQKWSLGNGTRVPVTSRGVPVARLAVVGASRLVIGFEDGWVQIVDLINGGVLFEKRVHNESVLRVAACDTGSAILTIGTEVAVPRVPSNVSGSYLEGWEYASRRQATSIKKWRLLESGSVELQWTAQPDFAITGVAVSDSGQWIATGDRGGRVTVWDNKTGTAIRTWTAGNFVGDVCVLDRGRFIGVAQDDIVTIWRCADASKVDTLEPGVGRFVLCMASFSITVPDFGVEEYIVCGGSARQVFMNNLWFPVK